MRKGLEKVHFQNQGIFEEKNGLGGLWKRGLWDGHQNKYPWTEWELGRGSVDEEVWKIRMDGRQEELNVGIYRIRRIGKRESWMTGGLGDNMG